MSAPPFPKVRIPLPPPGEPLDWAAVFGRGEAPRVVDLGCGNGQFLLRSAARRPGHDHLGIDIVPPSIRHAVERAVAQRLANARFAVGDAHGFVTGGGAAPASLAEVHVYHPQPYVDPAQKRMRLLTPAFLDAVRRALAPDGVLVVQSDNDRYWRFILTTVPLLFRFEPKDGPWPDAPEGRTLRETRARRRGMRVYRGIGRPRKDLADDEVAALLARLPEPDFEAARPAGARRGEARRQAGREH